MTSLPVINAYLCASDQSHTACMEWRESVEREGERVCTKGGCGILLGMECVEREGDGRGLAQVEDSDSKQSEMNVQCEQIISTHPPSTTHTSAHMHVSTVL